MIQTATTAYGHAVSYGDYVADPRASALRVWYENEDVEPWTPYSVISGMILADLTGASFGPRSDWWSKLDRASRVFRGFPAAPPAVDTPTERPLPCAPQLSTPKAIDDAQVRLASFAQVRLTTRRSGV